MSHVSREIVREGALADVLINVPAARLRLLQKHQMPIPPAVPVKAQVDTGAYCCGVDKRVLELLELRGEVDVEEVTTPSTTVDAPHLAPVYIVRLSLLGAEGDRDFGSIRVHAYEPHPTEEARAVIGRDILQYCHFEYDGIRRRFVLTF